MSLPFIDTSILLGGLIDFGKSSESAIAILDRIAAGQPSRAMTAWHCCLEFYSVSTRLPEEYRLNPDMACRLIDEEILGRMQVAGLPNELDIRFFMDAAANRVSGGRIYDFHICRVAGQQGADVLVTENKKDFIPFAGSDMSVMTAGEYLQSNQSH